MSRPIPSASGLLVLAFASGCPTRTMSGLECWHVTAIRTDDTTISMPATTQTDGCAITYSITLCMETPSTARLDYHYDYDCIAPAWSGEYMLPVEVQLHDLESGVVVRGIDVDWRCDANWTTCERSDGSHLLLESS